MSDEEIDDKDDFIIARSIQIFQSIISRLNETDSESAHARAVRLLHTKMTGTFNTVIHLCKTANHDCSDDFATLLRVMYDTLMQAIWILRDEGKRIERGNMYLDYYWVQKFELIKLFDNNKTGLSEHVKDSELREGNEEKIIEEYGRVKDRYLTNKGNKTRSNWYPGTLRELARENGFESEYEIMQRFLGGVVHSSPFSMVHGSIMDPKHTYLLAIHLQMRYLSYVGEAQGIEFTDEEIEFIDDAKKEWFNKKS